MKKRKLPLAVILGAGLLLCSLCLVAVFCIQVYNGTKTAHEIALKLDELLPERTQGVPGIYENTGMPVLEMNGSDYIGIFEIPAHGTLLPIEAAWDSKAFSSAGRYWGSAYDNTLVIGGFDYPGQLDCCDKLELGAMVSVTDMTGAEFRYAVAKVDRAKHAETQWLLAAEYDLTFFCRDLYTMEYIAVRCVLMTNNTPPL